MYEPETILTLKEQREPDADGNEFPYNRVKVIGNSVVSHSGQASEWVGANGQGVMIQPAGEGFGATLDEPYGKLQQIYDVESVPVHEIEVQKIVVRTQNQGKSPEEVFAELAQPSPNEQGRRWMPEEQRVSPLGEDPADKPRGPLDVPATPAKPKAVAPADDVPAVGELVE